MSELAALSDRIEAAEEGSQKLEWEIAQALFPGNEPGAIDATKVDFSNWLCTTSVDAALQLVPPGWTRAVDATAPELGIVVELFGRCRRSSQD